MMISTRTPEGNPLKCVVCGSEHLVLSSHPPGDSVCPTCGSHSWVATKKIDAQFPRAEVETKLADLGVIVETDDEGEVITAELHGPRLNDKTVHKLGGCNVIPTIKICNTWLTRQGIEKLREMLPNSIVEEI